MNQLPDRCPAVDDTTARRCMLSENHDGPHTDWTGGPIQDDAPAKTPIYWTAISAEDYRRAYLRRNPAMLQLAGGILVDRDDAMIGGGHYICYLDSGGTFWRSAQGITVDEFQQFMFAHITR
jgi:hypothetical protein